MANTANSENAARAAIVSFDSEELILVDEHDEEIGHETKGKCHDGHGILHRAFSLFVFNRDGELLLQQRSADKRLWPLYWSNTCCSHPRKGETMDIATRRRLHQELGFECEVEYLYKFQYQAKFEDFGSEHELCWVYKGYYNGEIEPNPNEVADSRWISPALIDQELIETPGHFTPWFKLEWAKVREQLSR